MRQSAIDKIYKKTRMKYPAIESEAQLEGIVRKRIFRRKVLIALSLYIFSLLMYFLFENDTINMYLEGLGTKTHETVNAVFGLIGGVSAIAAVMVFAKAAHDPLTPREARELQEKETSAKTNHK